MLASLLFHVGLHFVLLGIEVTFVFVGVSCDEPSDSKQMAHSQIVDVIVFSFFDYEIDVVLSFIGV